MAPTLRGSPPGRGEIASGHGLMCQAPSLLCKGSGVGPASQGRRGGSGCWWLLESKQCLHWG